MANLLRLFRLLLVLLLLGSLGCNLADYEARMVGAQNLQKQRDEEYRFLDGPIDVPAYATSGPPDIFLRLPLGINPQHENPEKPLTGLLIPYTRRPAPANPGGQPMPPNPNPPGQPATPGTSTYAAPSLWDVFVAYRVDSSSHSLASLIEEVQKQLQPPTQDPVKKKQRFQPGGRAPFDLEIIRYNSLNYTYLIAADSSPQTQVVVVYRFEKNKEAASQKALDLSLQSLALDEVAQQVRYGYNTDAVRRPAR